MTARAVMVLGCTSGAGKSWLTTALCRIYARKGLRVAPFKAQNMSNHARVASRGNSELGEIGSAQYFQALACGVVPDVRMNPVLLKPESDTRSQVIVMGQVVPELSQMGWRERSVRLAQASKAAYDTLSEEYELVILEGAGSPAETNLAIEDYVNLGAARWSGAACLLVSDIDRGGSFAHLYGTYSLMPADVRRQLYGYVLNRFRGDPSLLAPAPEDLEALTGVPMAAVIPYVHDHGLPEEDALPVGRRQVSGPRISVIAGPAASNLDEFEQLAGAGIEVQYVRSVAALEGADIVILPGSKQTGVDLAWLRRTGLDAAVCAHAGKGKAVLGICGGLQLLGHTIEDPYGLEGGGGGLVRGLGLLSVSTRFGPLKHVSSTRAVINHASPPWQNLNALQVEGYEIHVGQTSGDANAQVVVSDDAGRPIGWQEGSVFGLYLHGLLENPRVLAALFSISVSPLDVTFDRLADVVEASFKPGVLDRLIGA